MRDLILEIKFNAYVHTESSPISSERYINNVLPINERADSSGVGPRPLASWGCGFESRRGPGYLSLVNFVCCPVDVSALGWTLVNRRPTECGVSGVIVKAR
jgi:hypothetical protein